MALLGWKKFRFFDEVNHSEPSLPEGVSASCPGFGIDGDQDVWLGCEDGLLVWLDAQLAIKATFPGFQGRVHALSIIGSKDAPPSNKLLAVGEDGSKEHSLRCWDIPTLQAATNPLPTMSAKISKLPEAPITAIAMYPINFPTITVALGTSTGIVQLYKGDVTVKGGTLVPIGGRYSFRDNDRVTALHISCDDKSPEAVVFAVSSKSLAALNIATGQVLLEDDIGAEADCSTVTPQGELIVAPIDQDAVFFYTADEGRKAAVALRGKKERLIAFKQYLAAVVPEDVGGSPAAAATKELNMVLRIFDIANKVVAGSSKIETPVKWMVGGVVETNQRAQSTTTGVIIAINHSGTALHLRERPLQDRLDSLFRSRSFQLALQMAQAENASTKTLGEIHRFFGDFLYGKRDYDGAVQQYSATVGTLEPSYVIQKFLDAQRVPHMATYLEAVHEAGIATSDHTTLLLRCYTKLRDVSKLGHFVKSASPPLKFDATAAIRVLREAGYYEHALCLAATAEESELHLAVLLEDCHRYNEALEYIRGLGRHSAASLLHTYGSLLLAGNSVAATALLMELCLPQDNDPFVANLAEFTHLYTERPEDLKYACVTILNMSRPDLPSRETLYHTLLDLYLGGNGSIEPTTVDNSNVKRNPIDGSSSGAASTFVHKGEAMDLLKRGWPPGQDPAYNVERVLTTCRMHSFSDGLVFLYTNLRMYREAAAVAADARDWPTLLDICDRYGTASNGGDPQVWHDALERLSSLAAGPGAQNALKELLARIEARGIMAPLMVLPVLARNPRLELGLVKDYVARALEAENRVIAADMEEVERLKAQVAQEEATLQRLTTEPIVFQSSRDAQTGAPLELPSVHFLCGHSYNVRTLGDTEGEPVCPLCAPEHRKVKDLQRSFKSSAADKDAFFRQLRAADDGFGLVAEYYSKGLLNNTSVTTQQ